MARRPFDPAAHGWKKIEYRQGDVLDRGSVEALVDGRRRRRAPRVHHHRASATAARDINLEGSRNVFEAARRRGRKRLVYASSVAAYGFHDDDRAAHRGRSRRAATTRYPYSHHKAEVEALLDDVLDDADDRRLRLPAVHRRRAGGAAARQPDPLRPLGEKLPGRRARAVRRGAGAQAGAAGSGRPVPARPPRRRRDRAARRRARPRRRRASTTSPATATIDVQRPRRRARLVLGADARAGGRRDRRGRRPAAVPARRGAWIETVRRPTLMDTAEGAQGAALAPEARRARRRCDDGRAASTAARTAARRRTGSCTSSADLHRHAEAPARLADDVVLAVALLVVLADEDDDAVGLERGQRVLEREQRLALAGLARVRAPSALSASAVGRAASSASAIASSESDIQNATGDSLTAGETTSTLASSSSSPSSAPRTSSASTGSVASTSRFIPSRSTPIVTGEPRCTACPWAVGSRQWRGSSPGVVLPVACALSAATATNAGATTLVEGDLGSSAGRAGPRSPGRADRQQPRRRGPSSSQAPRGQGRADQPSHPHDARLGQAPAGDDEVSARALRDHGDRHRDGRHPDAGHHPAAADHAVTRSSRPAASSCAW